MALILLVFGVFAAAALFASDLPRRWTLLAAPGVMVYAGWAAHREWRKPWRVLVVPSLPRRVERGQTAAEGGAERDDAEAVPPILLDGAPLAVLDVRWRGPAAFVRGVGLDGYRHRTLLWPDVTSAHARRELRLAMSDRATSPSPASMAP